ncbi:MAG: oligosaccharide flippase family protein [Marmoricola sp.]
MTVTDPSIRRRLRGGVGIAVALAVMNVTTYAFNIVAARWLGPEPYGAVAAILGMLMVVNVLSLGLQATAARRVAAAPDDLPQIEAQIRRATMLCSVGLGLACLLAAPLFNALLHLDSLATAALIAVCVVPLTMMGGQAGLLQGESRWLPLSLIYLSFGFGRLLAGVVALAIRPDEFGATLGLAIGAFAPAIVGELALRHPTRGRRAPVPKAKASPVLREVASSSHALLAFLALSNADVVLARTLLSHQQAGLYAGGLILTKAVLFLPQFVVIVAFPSMARNSDDRSTRRNGLVLILATGLSAVAGALLLSSLTVTFVGGDAYASLKSDLWAWALLGTLLAMIQLLVYGVLARQHRNAVYLVWATLAVLLAAATRAHGPLGLLEVVLVADGSLFLLLLIVSSRSSSKARAATS